MKQHEAQAGRLQLLSPGYLQNLHENDLVAGRIGSHKPSVCDCVRHVLNGLCCCLVVCIYKQTKTEHKQLLLRWWARL